MLSQPALSNASYTYWNLVGVANVGTIDNPLLPQYAQGFTTGSDTRGYLLTEVRLGLLLRRGGSLAGTWAVHADDAGKPAAEPLSAALPNLGADLDGEVNTFEVFIHPDGVHLDPNTKYWLVISQTTSLEDGYIGVDVLTDWNGSLGEGKHEERPEGHTTSQVVAEYATPLVDPGSEDGWSLDPGALSYSWDESKTQLPELLPWWLLATSVALPEEARFVLRMSLVVAAGRHRAVRPRSDYTVDEGNSQSASTVTVELRPKDAPSPSPSRQWARVARPPSDYSVSTSVTFNSRARSTKTVDLHAHPGHGG